MRIKIFIAILTINFLILYSFELKSQTFEGIITYRTNVELPKNSNISVEQFNMMFQDIDTITNFYLKDSKYKLITLDNITNEPKTITLYNPKLDHIYNYMAGQNEFCMATEVNDQSLPNPKISTNLNDTLIIMGKKCHSMTIDYGQKRKSIIYFSKDYEVDVEQYANNPYGFLDYIYKTGALPLKIVISGNGAIHNLVFTAIEVAEEQLSDEIFKLPEFKRIMKSPF